MANGKLKIDTIKEQFHLEHDGEALLTALKFIDNGSDLSMVFAKVGILKTMARDEIIAILGRARSNDGGILDSLAESEAEKERKRGEAVLTANPDCLCGLGLSKEEVVQQMGEAMRKAVSDRLEEEIGQFIEKIA